MRTSSSMQCTSGASPLSSVASMRLNVWRSPLVPSSFGKNVQPRQSPPVPKWILTVAQLRVSSLALNDGQTVSSGVLHVSETTFCSTRKRTRISLSPRHR